MPDFHLHDAFFFHSSSTTEIYTLSLHDALPISAETEDDVPEQPLPSAVHGDPGQPAAHQSDENRRPEHFEMHDSFSLTGCSGSLPAISLDLLVFRIVSQVNMCHGILQEGIHGESRPSDRR